jgi:hypothetical protein
MSPEISSISAPQREKKRTKNQRMSLELELIWFVIVLGVTIGASWFGGSVGLSISYLISLGFIHFWGGLIHAFPWYHGGEGDYTRTGFDQFAWAVTAFAVSRCVIAPLISRYFRTSGEPLSPPGLAQLVILIGAILYGFLQSVLAGIPSFAAITSCGGSLFLAGFCLLAWQALQEKKPAHLVFIFAALAFLPFFTIISAGFLGYGAGAALVVVAFLVCQVRSRLLGLLFLSIAVYFGFCTFMTYMRDRADIRDEMWDEDSSFAQRFDRLKTTFTKFELIDFKDQDQLDRIEGRLNQNDLVGRAVSMLDSGAVDFAEGETFRQAAKPVVAGSPDIVSYFTGQFFAPGTSVGIGQVMEGYVNFGTLGVIAVFVIFGVALGIIDVKAARKLKSGDTLGFIVWFVPGIGMLQPGGSLVEVAATVAASIVLVQGLRIPLAMRKKKAADEAGDAGRNVWRQKSLPTTKPITQ